MPDPTTVDVLAEIWSELLGIEPIEPEDRFTELGGSSLLAESMQLHVRRRLGTSATATLLADDPTLAVLADRIERHRAERFGARGEQSTTTLRRPDAPHAPTLHCIAGAGSSALAFLPLAAVLDPSWGVHAHQQHGLESRATPALSVAGAARRHARAITRIQPHGPLHLLGHSYGGHVATEVARRLLRAGRSVTGLHLIDTLGPPKGGESVGDMEAPAPRSRASLSSRLRTHLRVSTAGLVAHDPATHQALMWEQAVRAQNRYRVRPLPSGAVVVVTDQNADQAERWAPMIPSDGRLVRLGSGHNAILSDERDLARLAALIEVRATTAVSA